jgi:hypothetical protein
MTSSEPAVIPEWRIEGDWLVTPGRITVGHALRNVVTAFGKRWSWANHSAKHIPFDMRGPGAFTWRAPLGRQP